MQIQSSDVSREASTVGTSGPRLIAGTMVTTDIGAARRFYETFLGLECVRCAPDRLLLRDRYAKAEMESGGDDFFVIDVMEVAEISNPQRMLHHWGLDVVSAEEVNRIHAQAKARKEELGLTKLMPISAMHGAHSFYFADRDSNWWEIEYRLDGLDNEGFFARGDIETEAHTNQTTSDRQGRLIDLDMPPQEGALVTNARLTHGTCEQLNLARARRFLEDVLGLRCVHHLTPAQILAGRGSFGVFAIGLPRLKQQQVQNRWIVSIDTKEEVEATAARAHVAQAKLGLQHIGTQIEDAASESITIQDADGNWWEVTSRTPNHYRQLFAVGDIS